MPESISALLEEIEIPDAAYETAQSRYEDLGRWLCRPESTLSRHDPLVFPQGSFLLGTVTRPRTSDGAYDLDLAIKLRRGVSKRSHTQKQLKQMVGAELEAYRNARGVKAALDEKKRCWRIEYADHMSFHIDAVPCIPEDTQRQQRVREAILARDAAATVLANEVSPLAVSITDNTRQDYECLCDGWNVSNPQGYGLWFSGRVRLARYTVQNRLMTEKRAEVQELPVYKLKAPLQRVVQLLKLHRDEMFKDDQNSQPISIIITTLSARAYEGQEDVTEALLRVLDTMDQHLHPSTPRVPNPVNPEEDFSDKWDSEEGRRLELERHFHLWLHAARRDFRLIVEAQDADGLVKRTEETLGVKLNLQHIRGRFGTRRVAPTIVSTPRRIEQAPRPWADR